MTDAGGKFFADLDQRWADFCRIQFGLDRRSAKTFGDLLDDRLHRELGATNARAEQVLADLRDAQRRQVQADQVLFGGDGRDAPSAPAPVLPTSHNGDMAEPVAAVSEKNSPEFSHGQR